MLKDRGLNLEKKELTHVRPLLGSLVRKGGTQMSAPQYDTDYAENEGVEPIQSSASAPEEAVVEGYIRKYLKNRFSRLYNQTQPRQAIEASRRDFEARRTAALEMQEPLIKR